MKVSSQERRVVLDGQVADITAKRNAVAEPQEQLGVAYPPLDLLRVDTEPLGEKEIANRVTGAHAQEPVFTDAERTPSEA